MFTYRTLAEYRTATLGTVDDWHYRNAETGRRISLTTQYRHVILIGENHWLGYRSAAELETTDHGWQVVRAVFDQHGECRTIADLLEVLSYMDDQR